MNSLILRIFVKNNQHYFSKITVALVDNTYKVYNRLTKKLKTKYKEQDDYRRVL